LPTILFAARVHAPVDQITKVITSPQHYPEFMPALDSVRIVARRSNQTAYDWTWKTSLFSLSGHTIATTMIPPPDRAMLGVRIDVEQVRGDLGSGRMLWRIFPESNDVSLVVFSSRIDIRKANWITKQIEHGKLSIN